MTDKTLFFAQKKFEKWHIELCCAPCKATGLCCKSCFTPCCSAYSQRVTLLEAEEGGLEKKYLCCNGAFCAEDCCMTECCCRKCPRCCLCMESFVCCWCAVVANRSIIQRRYGIKVDNPRSCGFAVSCPLFHCNLLCNLGVCLLLFAPFAFLRQELTRSRTVNVNPASSRYAV